MLSIHQLSKSFRHFVLTMKCTVGHGKANFDAQVDQAVCNLKDKAETRDVSVVHLFSNRIGERTIIGKLI